MRKLLLLPLLMFIVSCSRDNIEDQSISQRKATIESNEQLISKIMDLTDGEISIKPEDFDEVRKGIVESMYIPFVESLKPAFEKSKASEEEFIRHLCNGEEISDAGKNILILTYSYLSNDFKNEEIILIDSGIETIELLLHIKYNNSDLFGSNPNPSYSYNTESSECKWYDFVCHIKDFFAPENIVDNLGAIMNEVIEIIEWIEEQIDTWNF